VVVEQPYEKKLGDSPANFLINRGVMATLQERRLGYHSRAGFEPGTNGFSTLRINHYAARGIPRRPCKHRPEWLVRHAYAIQVATAVQTVDEDTRSPLDKGSGRSSCATRTPRGHPQGTRNDAWERHDAAEL
jgi:hypothetical protein